MPIKIHHGPPGSFKTAGAMADDFIREAKAGRLIVTNVRGVTKERVLKVFPNLPDTFDVINVPDTDEEGRKRWAEWFHWVPKGAFIFVDEVQDIWPKRWKEADIRALDYPGGLRKATADDRPFCWDQAWDKHRHWNWDIVATCPAYSKVREDIKAVADAAYKHKDLALIGWTGRYVEAMHLADDTGKAQSDFLTIQQKKVPSHVFKLYDSTATGAFRVNANGFNLFKSPRVALLLSILCGALYFGFAGPPVKLFPGSPSVATANPGGAPSASSGGQVMPVSTVAVPPVDFSKDARVEPLIDGDAFILASFRGAGRHMRYEIRHRGARITDEDLLDMGYAVTPRGFCGLHVARDGFQRFITCDIPKEERREREAEKSVAAADKGRAVHDSGVVDLESSSKG